MTAHNLKLFLNAEMPQGNILIRVGDLCLTGFRYLGRGIIIVKTDKGITCQTSHKLPENPLLTLVKLITALVSLPLVSVGCIFKAIGYLDNDVYDAHMLAKEQLLERKEINFKISSSQNVEKNLKKNQKMATSSMPGCMSRLFSFVIQRFPALTLHKIGENAKILDRGVKTKSLRVGTRTAHIASFQGRRDSMQDAHLATSTTILYENTRHPVSIFGVFDGHGGKGAAQYLKSHFATTFARSFSHIAKDADLLHFSSEDKRRNWIMTNALQHTFASLQEDWKNMFRMDPSGSTASVALIFENKLYVANIGDSKVVLSDNGHTRPMTDDQSPKGRYKRRVEKRGGTIVNGKPPRVEGMLAVAGAFGDVFIRGIALKVDVTSYDLRKLAEGGKNFLIVGSDGLWDVTTPRRAVDYVSSMHDLTRSGDHLVRYAYNEGSTDNISALCVTL